jgi:hypothetical protein
MLCQFSHLFTKNNGEHQCRLTSVIKDKSFTAKKKRSFEMWFLVTEAECLELSTQIQKAMTDCALRWCFQTCFIQNMDVNGRQSASICK